MSNGLTEYNELIKTIVNDIVEQKKNDNKSDNDNEIYYDVVTESKQQDNRVSFTETKYTEMKTLDNGFLQKYDVKLYGSDKDNYDIINDFLQENQSEEAFYIIDLGEIVKSYNNWIRMMPDVKPFYAVKCNPNPVILEALSELGVNFDCASEKEIRNIIDITNDPSRIIFANPIKMSSKIRFARSNDVDILVFDSEYELFKIKLFHPNAKLILRLAVDDSHSICRFNCKFGSKLNEVEELLMIAKTLKLNIIGFSFHVGSGCLSPEPFYNALADCRQATDIALKLGFNISIIDIGGGFPGVDKKIRFEDIANRVNDGIRDFFNEENANKKIQFIAEPGRYFAQKTHTLVINVIGKKVVYDEETREKINVYYLNEGTYGSFNCIQNDHYEPTLLPFNEQKETCFRSKIFGQSCDSIDVIANDILLPELAIGESLYVENFGSYTLSASSANFNGFTPTSKFKYIFKDQVQN
uniref:ornithine decarboxylase n=1 Tax=viral metagenome TaxID=1070528 RepID=A0A6C0E885_9ZZZZ